MSNKKIQAKRPVNKSVNNNVNKLSPSKPIGVEHDIDRVIHNEVTRDYREVQVKRMMVTKHGVAKGEYAKLITEAMALGYWWGLSTPDSPKHPTVLGWDADAQEGAIDAFNAGWRHGCARRTKTEQQDATAVGIVLEPLHSAAPASPAER